MLVGLVFALSVSLVYSVNIWAKLLGRDSAEYQFRVLPNCTLTKPRLDGILWEFCLEGNLSSGRMQLFLKANLATVYCMYFTFCTLFDKDSVGYFCNKWMTNNCLPPVSPPDCFLITLEMKGNLSKVSARVGCYQHFPRHYKSGHWLYFNADNTNPTID